MTHRSSVSNTTGPARTCADEGLSFSSYIKDIIINPGARKHNEKYFVLQIVSRLYIIRLRVSGFFSNSLVRTIA